ncbi:hypothetical protein Q7O_002161 [Pectobacterium carotovorum subsp. carotovorum PCCS1]|nr:hypothetical protein [Pectobacterium carotovorum subsp. carotovorum PCCS1]
MIYTVINDEKQSHGHISSLYCGQVVLPDGSKIYASVH